MEKAIVTSSRAVPVRCQLLSAFRTWAAGCNCVENGQGYMNMVRVLFSPSRGLVSRAGFKLGSAVPQRFARMAATRGERCKHDHGVGI